MSAPWEDFQQTATADPANAEPWNDYAPVKPAPWDDFSPKPVAEPLAQSIRDYQNPDLKRVDEFGGLPQDPKTVGQGSVHGEFEPMLPLAVAGRVVNALVQDAMATFGTGAAGDVSQSGETGGNLFAIAQDPAETLLGKKELPSQRMLRELSATNPKTAVMGKVAGSVVESAPMLALPGGAAGRLIALGFSAQMIYGAKDSATALGEELGKPPEERDMDKITSAAAQLISAGVMAPLAAAHGAADPIGENLNTFTKKQQAIKALAEQLRTMPAISVKPRMAIVQNIEAAGAPATAKVTEAILPKKTFSLDLSKINLGQTPEPLVAKLAPATAQAAEEAIKTTTTKADEIKPEVPPEAVVQPAGSGGVGAEKSTASPAEIIPPVGGEVAAKPASDLVQSGMEKKARGEQPTPEEAAALDKSDANNQVTPEQIAELQKLGIEWPPKAEPVEPAAPAENWLDTAAEKARAHLRSKGGRVMTGIDPTDLAAHAVIAAQHIRNGVKNVAELSTKLASEFGDGVSQHAQEIWDKANEILKTGAGTYGVANRVNEARAKAGVIAPVEPGVGNSAEELVQMGREALQSGADPHTTLQHFQQTKKVSALDFGVVRAHGEVLAKAANAAADEFGIDSPEYKTAAAVDHAWQQQAVQPMKTEWSNIGRGTQGETDIDTGTFHGLARAVREVTGEDLTPDQAKKAKNISSEVRKAEEAVEPVKEKLAAAIDNIGEEVPPHVRALADKIKGFFDTQAEAALARIRQRRSEGRLFTGIPVEDLADYAAYGASKILAKGVEGGEMTAEWAADMAHEIGDYIKPHLNEIWDASKKYLDEGFKKVAGRDVPKRVRRAIKPEDADSAEASAKRALKIAEEVGARARKEMEESEKAAKGSSDRKLTDRADADRRASDAANRTVREAAVRAANAETKARVAKAKLDVETRKAASQAEADALDAANEVAKRAARDAAKAEEKRRVAQSEASKVAADAEAKRTKSALEAAQKTVREAAVRKAKAEEAARVAAVVAKSAEWRKSIEGQQAEFRRFKSGDEMTGDQLKTLWQRVKKYIDDGNDSHADIVNKVATDLGIPVKDVLAGLKQNREVKRVADDVWQKQRQARILKSSAKRWVEESQKTFLSKIVPTAAKLAFSAKTGFHGTVAMGTHAALVAAEHPRIFADNFGKMYKLVLSPEYYEMQAHDLSRRPFYDVAQRNGLVNDMSKMEDFNDPKLAAGFPKLAEYFRKKLGRFGNIQGMGTRGYAVLKILRQDLFDHEWSKLAESERTDNMAKAIADSVNHITGVVKTGSHPAANVALFAPKLALSRISVIVGDPLRAVNSLTKLSNMSPAERWFAVNQFKSKAKIFAVASSLLLANQTLLNIIGDKRKINGVPEALGGGGINPMASDFMKFKAGGMNFAWGGPFLTMTRLPLRIIKIGVGDGGKSKFLIYPDESMSYELFKYARTQESPMLAPIVSLVTKADYQGRPLPQIPGYGKPPPMPKRLAAQGIHPYTWKEFATETVLPIPFEEGAREVFHYMNDNRPDQEQATDAAMKAFITITIMGATGGRLTEDYDQK